MFKSTEFLLLLLASFASSAPSQNSTSGDVTTCLKAFYRAAYNGDYNCTDSFDFFMVVAKNLFVSNVHRFQVIPELQQLGFTLAKSCFLEIAKEECSVSQYNLLSTKYQQFLDVLTTQPAAGTSCSNFYFKYNSLKCQPLIEDLAQKAFVISDHHLKLNDTKILDTIDLCAKVEMCLVPECYHTEKAKKGIHDSCKEIGMRNTEFTACLLKIQKLQPDFSEYSCLDDLDFSSPSEQVVIELFTTKKDCSYKIMKEFCGEKAVQDFNYYASLTVRVNVKASQVNNVFTFTLTTYRIMYILLHLIFTFLLLLGLAFTAPSQNSTNADVTSCLTEFYRMAYTGEYNCTKSLDLFSDNQETKIASFKKAKSCFLEVAKEECPISQYNFLSTKYDSFLDSLSATPPAGASCSDLYYKYNSAKCTPLYEEVGKKMMPLATLDVKLNDTRVLELLRLCDKTMECLSLECYYPEEKVKYLHDRCEEMALKNTEFAACLIKIDKLSPDFSEYPCLDGLDFNSQNEETRIEILLKKKCAKTIMEDICGERAIDNFDYNTALTVRILVMNTQLRKVVFDNV
ncbi:hypothetical protein CRE_09320 [Caenorhabditis remanei]|uniref:T20D4.11-like domain-containing protein n=1 Tax=Caenorhabditis remanei TaxID=31234 RepID=E3LI46_CAERE|nr:hypothetical protein CRE_09320 [Caenorhabditis remanei]